MVERSRRYAWYVLGLLTLINFVNYVDRMVIVAMYDPLRDRFGLTDTQLGALGSGFFFVHAVMTLPFGWGCDRWDRRKLMAGGVIFWSLATLGSAYAVGFLSLFLMRALIGVGEAAYGPVSNAVLCETFEPGEKARTVAIFNGGMFAGACVGVAVGGWWGFPTAFEIVAIPGLALGVLAARLKIAKYRIDANGAPPPAARFRTMLIDGWRSINVPTLNWMMMSGILISFAAGGYIFWFVDFVMNFKHLPRNQAILVYGGIAVTGGLTGVITGGLVADWLMKRYRNGRVMAIAIGFFLAVPFAFGAIFIPGGWTFYVSSWLLMFFIPWYNGPMAAVIDDVVDDSQASTAQGSFSFVLHLVGTAPASAAVGLVSSWTNLQYALILPTAAIALAGVFALLAARHVAADMRARDERARVAAAQRVAA